MNYDVINNEEDKRFEIHIDGQVAFEDYDYFTTPHGEKGIAYLHTKVPPELGGRGLATYLVKYILDYAQQRGLKVKPACSFVKSYIDKHPEYQANSFYH
ncbi:GNAT family N-acetyltransferase [Alkanindiges sp. WGS2144]|uniref:GNAT family N-acetyltransferase n=1 Tax=Alkanindiges sp. WGS2144 TaxID=3366808 RepID=UPI003751CB84